MRPENIRQGGSRSPSPGSRCSAVGLGTDGAPGQVAGRAGAGRCCTVTLGAGVKGVGVQAGQATKPQAQGSQGADGPGWGPGASAASWWRRPLSDSQYHGRAGQSGTGRRSAAAPRALCRGQGARQQGQGWRLWRTKGRRGKRLGNEARVRPIASGRGSHRCRRRRATHGRGGPRVTLVVRLRSGREVWGGEPSHPTLPV